MSLEYNFSPEEPHDQEQLAKFELDEIRDQILYQIDDAEQEIIDEEIWSPTHAIEVGLELYTARYSLVAVNAAIIRIDSSSQDRVIEARAHTMHQRIDAARRGDYSGLKAELSASADFNRYQSENAALNNNIVVSDWLQLLANSEEHVESLIPDNRPNYN